MQLTGEEQRKLDAVIAAATPGTTEVDIDGWQAKASPDLPFRRCNVATPPPDAAADPGASAALAAVRRALAEHGRRLVVAISSARPDHEVLDAWLAREGLDLEAPVRIMVAPLDQIAARAEVDRSEVAVSGPPVGPAPVGVAATGPTELAREAGYRALLGRVPAASSRRPLVAVAHRPDAPEAPPTGLAFGLVDGTWVGLFGMLTSPEHRRQGVASALVAALGDGARRAGATQAYLQVEEANVPAIALYEGLGFATSHRHHYRSEPAAAEHGTIAEAGC